MPSRYDTSKEIVLCPKLAGVTRTKVSKLQDPGSWSLGTSTGRSGPSFWLNDLSCQNPDISAHYIFFLRPSHFHCADQMYFHLPSTFLYFPLQLCSIVGLILDLAKNLHCHVLSGGRDNPFHVQIGLSLHLSVHLGAPLMPWHVTELWLLLLTLS